MTTQVSKFPPQNSSSNLSSLQESTLRTQPLPMNELSEAHEEDELHDEDENEETEFDKSGVHIPRFLSKLLRMIEDETSLHLISWSHDGTSFEIHDQPVFAKEVLPKYFKHSNISSFVRQLNMYGFKKKLAVDHGSLQARRLGSLQWEFVNPQFQRGRPDLLKCMKRKAAATDDKKTKETEHLKTLIEELQSIKEQQRVLTNTFKGVRQEHKGLQYEVANLRKKHQKQQQTIEKILQFLASVYAPDRLLESAPSPQKRMKFLSDAPLLNSASSSNHSLSKPTSSTMYPSSSASSTSSSTSTVPSKSSSTTCGPLYPFTSQSSASGGLNYNFADPLAVIQTQLQTNPNPTPIPASGQNLALFTPGLLPLDDGGLIGGGVEHRCSFDNSFADLSTSVNDSLQFTNDQLEMNLVAVQNDIDAIQESLIHAGYGDSLDSLNDIFNYSATNNQIPVKNPSIYPPSSHLALVSPSSFSPPLLMDDLTTLPAPPPLPPVSSSSSLSSSSSSSSNLDQTIHPTNVQSP